ncbi:hypothetical protein AVEN_153858-1 [Araneus ventricosus]|uniref:Uncharacterized protein n=1 Tax=Araneus ventricosus TaxID=182803 RepID=A0A4Y2UEA1_ARAVE|nr:hypothetical protein AVEN_153858-1 [Araneus ventricosus]
MYEGRLFNVRLNRKTDRQVVRYGDARRAISDNICYCRQLAIFSWHVNMASKTDAPAKCELRSIIRFLQAQGWLIKKDQCSCFLSVLLMTGKSPSDFRSFPHS